MERHAQPSPPGQHQPDRQGVAIALAGPTYLGSVSYFLASLSILIGMAILFIRPWDYLRRLEIEMQVQKDAASMAKA